MMKLLCLVVSLFFLGLCSSIETEILVDSRAKSGYTLEFEFEQQLLGKKHRGLNVLPLSIKASVEFNNDDYFVTPKNYKSLQFDLIFTSNYAIDQQYNYDNNKPKRDVPSQRVKVLKDYHLTQDDLVFNFEHYSKDVEREEKESDVFKNLDYSQELVGQLFSDEGDRLGASQNAFFSFQSMKGGKSDVYVDSINANTLVVFRFKKEEYKLNRDSIFNETLYRNPLPENDADFIMELLQSTCFVLKSVRRVDTVYSPYGNPKSKYQFDLKYKTSPSKIIDTKLFEEIENLPTHTEESRALLQSLRAKGSDLEIPIQLRGRVGYSKLNLVSTKRAETYVMVDPEYLDYLKFELVFVGEGFEETVLYTFGLSSTEIIFAFESGIDLTKELFGQKTKNGKFEDMATFVFYSNANRDIIFVPTGQLTENIVATGFDRIMPPKDFRRANQQLVLDQIVQIVMMSKTVQFDLISIQPPCTPKKINTKLTKYGVYQDCLFPQNKQMECYSFKALFPSGTEPTSCVVEECSSVDSLAFNRKCSRISSVKNICKIDSVKQQVCVKREACTGAKKGDSCARVYQFLGENKKDTCKVEEPLALASIVAPFNDGSMQFKSNKYCH